MDSIEKFELPTYLSVFVALFGTTCLIYGYNGIVDSSFYLPRFKKFYLGFFESYFIGKPAVLASVSSIVLGLISFYVISLSYMKSNLRLLKFAGFGLLIWLFILGCSIIWVFVSNYI